MPYYFNISVKDVDPTADATDESKIKVRFDKTNHYTWACLW